MSLLKLFNWVYNLGNCYCTNDILAISKKLKKSKSQLIANIMSLYYLFMRLRQAYNKWL